MDAFGREKKLLLRGVIVGCVLAAVMYAWLGYTTLNAVLLAVAAAFGLLAVLILTLSGTSEDSGFWALVATMTMIAVTYPATRVGEDAVWHAVVMMVFVGALMISPRATWSDGVWLIATVMVAHSVGHLAAGSGAELGESLAMGAVSVGGTWLVSRMRSRLEATQERFREVLDGAPVAIWQEDFSGVREFLDSLEENEALSREQVLEAAGRIRVMAVNRAAVELVDAGSKTQLLGPLSAVGITDDTFAALAVQVAAVKEGRTDLEVDVLGSTMKGNPFEGVLYWTVPKVDAGLDLAHVTVAMTDVSRLKDAERRLVETIRLKDRFVAGVSHEIRTPLASVIGLTSEIADRYDSFSDEERRELLRLVSGEASEASAIVEDLLVAARVDSGNVMIHSATFDVVGLVDALAASFTPTPAIELPGRGMEVFADSLRIRQILRNLLTNARRYGGPVVTVSVREEGSSVIVEVRDNGPGVPDAARQAIFDAYNTAGEGKQAATSIGLGLYISRQLAELMGGSLEYARVHGETVFRLTVPASKEHAFKSPAEAPVGLSGRLVVGQ